ncbi:MAG: MarR family transcriptional regulator [Bdellovibrio sp.]|nr:MarR family transcriptional regulator [Bdellovibrio sp.]
MSNVTTEIQAKPAEQNMASSEEMQLHLLLRKITSEFETALEAFFDSWGITTTRFVVLNLLYNSPNGMTPTETAKAVGVTNATISAIISGLKQAGLIQPIQNAGDSRSYRMQLTDSGLELMRKIYPAYNENIMRLWSQFDSAEKKNLGNLMTRVSQLLGVMGKSR